MKPSAILFDCDGVLVDSEVIYKEVEHEHLNAIGLSYPIDYIARFTGLSGDNFLREIQRDYEKLGKGSVPESFQADLAAATMDRFENDLMAIAGAGDFVSALTLPIAIASSSAMERLHWKLRHTDLHHHFAPHIPASKSKMASPLLICFSLPPTNWAFPQAIVSLSKTAAMA